MSARAILILLIAAALTTAAAAWSYRANHRLAVDLVRGERLIPDLVDKVNEVAAVETSDAAGTLKVVRKDEGWVIDGRGYPADAEKLQRLLVALVQFSKLEAKTAVAAKYPLLELDDPQSGGKGRLVTLSDKEGATLAAIVLGKPAPGRAGPGKDAQYVRLAGEPQSWLVLGRIDAASDVTRFADPKVVAIGVDAVARARIVHPDGEILEVVRNGVTEAGTPKFEIAGGVPEGRKVKSDIGVRYTATDLANLEFTDVRPAKAGGIEAARAELETEDGLKLAYRLVEEDGQGWVSVEVIADGKDPAAAEDIRKRTAGWEYRLSEYKAKQLKKRKADLIE
jgi:hypothetical protein